MRNLVAHPRQITHALHGHILTNTAVWSPDGEWIVYDVRSDSAGSVFDGTRIGRVHVETGRVEVLYEARNGACCGVATYHPLREEVVFILGPENPTPDWQYSACHRQGVIVDTARPQEIRNLDARDIVPPFTPGALRGGSHVHVFSGDGRFVSFTYEDHVLSKIDDMDGVGGMDIVDLNQRNVGVSLVGTPVTVPKTHPRNHDGTTFSVLLTRTVNNPQPGSGEISRAYEDAWIGSHGYVRADGSRQNYALAFLGDVVTESGQAATELFIVDLPCNIVAVRDEPLEGTPTRRPAPPLATRQRRLTFTSSCKYPGIQGPRHWPRSSPDGSRIAFLMRNNEGQVQLWTISPNGGAPTQVTDFDFDIASAFTWHRDGEHIALIADGSVWVINTNTGESQRLMAPTSTGSGPRPEACVFSPDGSRIAFVQPVVGDGATYNQIFVVKNGLS